MRKILTICAALFAALFITTFASFAYAAPTVCSVGNGCTGWPNIVAGSLLYGNGVNRLATTTAGSNGNILFQLNGIPTWGPSPTTTANTWSALQTITFASSTSATINNLFSTNATTTTLGITNLISTLLFASAGGGIVGSSTIDAAFGGTGSSTPLGGILAGNGQGPVKSVIMGSGVTFDGTTLSANLALSGGTTGMLTAWTSASALTATSGPTAAFFWATSTTQASFFPQATTTQLTTNDMWALLGSNHVAIFNDGSSASALGLINGSLIGQSSQFQIAAAGTSQLAFYTGATRNTMTAGTLRMLGTVNGTFGIATSTPNAQLTIASSTGSQFSLSDTNLNDFTWNIRAMNNNLYFATSTGAATSTTAAFSISNTGIPNFGDAPLPANSGGTGATSLSASSFIVAGGVLKAIAFPSFQYATSTAWTTGTTSVYSLESSFTLSMVGFRCNTAHGGGGTLNVQFGNGTASTSVYNASSTNNYNALTSPLTINAGQWLAEDMGTPSGTPTKIVCTPVFNN